MSSSLAPLLGLRLPATFGRCQRPRTTAELSFSRLCREREPECQTLESAPLMSSGQDARGESAGMSGDSTSGTGGVTILSSGQGCGDADLRGQGLMNGATLGDVQ